MCTDVKLIRIATPHPFPEQFVKNALDGVTEVMCLEELSPYIENQILRLAGKYAYGYKCQRKADR